MKFNMIAILPSFFPLLLLDAGDRQTDIDRSQIPIARPTRLVLCFER